MNSLQPQFDAIETQRREIGAQFEKLSDAERQFQPKAGDWSALQIVEHLILSDETVGSLPWSRRQIAASKKAPGVHRGRQKLILWALRRDVRLPLPSPDIEPRGDVAWIELQTRWETARSELREHLEAPDFDAESRPYFHTVAGALSTGELLELSAIHTAYHARQLMRLIEAQPPRAGSR